MSAKAAPSCPNCQAPLPLGGDAEIVTCEYCGRQVMREQPPPPAPPPNAVRTSVGRAQQARVGQAPARGPKGLIVALAVLPLVVGGIIAATVAIKAQKAATLDSNGPGGGGYTPSGVHLQWSGVAPVAVDLNGDGVEDIVGRYNVLEKGSTHAYVGAFDGKKLERIWKAGSYGTISDAQAIHVAVSGDRVLVSDASNFVHILELTTGKELRNVRLTDKVKELCPFAEEPASVWIAVADEQNVKLDLATGETRIFGRPGFCPGRETLSANSSCWSAEYHRSRHSHAECRPAEEAPILEGFRTEHVLAEGADQIAIGVKDPGTRNPMAMGFEGESGSKRVLWSRNVSADAREGSLQVTDLIDGRAILLYQSKRRGWRLVALDATTGNTVYDVEIPRTESGSGPSDMLLTAARVYVPHWTWLDIFETASGEHLGTIGIW